jgi:acyl-CoA thioester hydrolase
MGNVSLTQPFEMEINVQPEDIDELGHVNNVVYLTWVQNVSTAHWNAASPNGHEPSSIVWVVIQHEIRYKQPTYLKDTVIARTWIGKAKRRYMERNTELLRKSDGTLLARAVTLWTPVDKDTGKSVEIEADVLGLFAK